MNAHPGTVNVHSCLCKLQMSMAAQNPIQKSIHRYLGWLVFTTALAFCAALVNGIGVAMIAPVMMGLLGLELDLRGLPTGLQRASELISGIPETTRTIWTSAFVLLAVITKNAFILASVVASAHVSKLIVADMRQQTLNILLRADMDFFARVNPGTISNLIMREIDEVGWLIIHCTNLASLIPTALVLIVILLITSWQLTLATFVLLAVTLLLNQWIIGLVKTSGTTAVENGRRLAAALNETFSGIRLVKTTASESREYESLATLSTEHGISDAHARALTQSIVPIGEVTGVLALLGIVCLARIFIPEQIHGFSAVLLTFLFVLFRLLPQINSINHQRGEVNRLMSSAKAVIGYLSPEGKVSVQSGTVPYVGLKNAIQFESVSFAYSENRKGVLHQVDFSIPKGATVALVGRSGAGKSTCADLLLRFYDPTDGRIRIDGIDLRDFELTSLRRSMAAVSQDTFLFNHTVKYNITYGKVDATQAEIIDAAGRAHALEFIEKLPQGLDTIIGDRGVMLSGGERQRLAVARALLLNPDILILDEATSSLDLISERLIQEALEILLRERTTLVIAHRLSTIQNAHSIVVLDNGRVAEVGTHSELLSNDGCYKSLYYTQFQKHPDVVVIQKVETK